MKALTTLRNVSVIVLFALAAATASAADGGKKVRPTATKSPVAQSAAPRHEVAPFVDPSAPLGDLVKSLSTQN